MGVMAEDHFVKANRRVPVSGNLTAATVGLLGATEYVINGNLTVDGFMMNVQSVNKNRTGLVLFTRNPNQAKTLHPPYATGNLQGIDESSQDIEIKALGRVRTDMNM